MTTDRMTVRTVVVTLACVVLGGVASMVFLTAVHTAIPDQLDRVVSLSLGALAGILAKTSTAPDDDEAPQNVQVVNDTDEPVPVEATRVVPPPPIVRP